MEQNRQSKRRNTARNSVDGFVPRQTVRNTTIGPASRGSSQTLANFKQTDGFNPRAVSGKKQMPDGRSLGRRPIYKHDIKMDIQETPKKRTKKSKHGIKQAARRSFAGLSALVLFIAGSLIGLLYFRANQVFEGGASALALECEIDPSRVQKEGDGRVNILVLGKGGPGHDGADLTDTLLVASIDSCQKEMGLLSIPRDLYVETEDAGSMKINSVYSTYKQQALSLGKSKQQSEELGIQATEKAVEEVTSLPMHYYAMVDFEAFRRAIDTVGGVNVNVKEPLYDPSIAWENNWDPLIAAEGEQTFDGKTALLYARSRYSSERGDFDRSERQKEILVALRDKIFSLGTFSNPLKMSQLLEAFGSHVRTNLSIDDLSSLYTLGQEIDGSKITSIGLADPPNEYVTTSNVYGLSVVIPKAGINNYSEIHSFLRNKLRDGFLQKENATILVLNGTNTAGLGTKTTKLLKSYGYTVSNTGDAPTKDYTETKIIDMRSNEKKFTRRYLELRFGKSATTDLPGGVNPEMADFVIIVGTDEI